MAAPGSEYVTPGALFELVARGNKDKYFFSDDRKITESPFNNIYQSSEPHLGEVRTTVPNNAVDFGKMVEFTLETFGDVLTDMSVLIKMPTWLPSLPVIAGGTTYPPSEANSQYHITSTGLPTVIGGLSGTDRNVAGTTTPLSGGFTGGTVPSIGGGLPLPIGSITASKSYGWVRGIAYLLFEKIQIFQDNVLLQEVSGDSLLALDQTSSTNAQYYLRAAEAGMHNGTAREIAAAATPGTLRLRIPFPGLAGKYDGGLPLCALKEQTFKIRLWLRSAEDLWESSPATSIAPWNTTFNVPGVVTGVGISGRSSLGNPELLLETRQIYLTEDQIAELRATHVKIPFIQYYDETYTIGEADYVGLDRGGTSIVQRRLEGRHPMERLLLNFRSSEWLATGQLWRIGGTEFYNSVGLLIAGTDREYAWSSSLLHGINGLVKDERFMASRGQSELRWSINEGLGPNRMPTGTVNFSTASRPTLTIDLKNVAPYCGQRLTYLQVCGESWAQYEIRDGRGRLVFID